MKRILNISAWVLVVLAVVITLGFTNNAQDQARCWNLEIKVDRSNNMFFVSEPDVMKRIIAKGQPIIGQPLEDLDLGHIESQLISVPAIENAEVFKTIDGQLKVRVWQRRPIVRIMNRFGKDVYIDEHGKFMPLSDKYSARVVVVNGYIDEPFTSLSVADLREQETEVKKFLADDIYELAKKLDQDKFWKAQIQQIYVNKDKELELIPRVGNHTILLGDASDLDKKFNKLKVFYLKGLANTDWNRYAVVNLKYENQIVCTKR